MNDQLYHIYFSLIVVKFPFLMKFIRPIYVIIYLPHLDTYKHLQAFPNKNVVTYWQTYRETDGKKDNELVL